jgi:hypothetical protein
MSSTNLQKNNPARGYFFLQKFLKKLLLFSWKCAIIEMAPCEGEKNYNTPRRKSQEKIGENLKKVFS